MAKKRLTCGHCEAPLSGQQRRGRPQRFCSDACRKAAQRRRNKCRHCGQLVEDKRSYCSNGCYYYDNWDTLPPNKMHLAAWDEGLIPFVPLGQQRALDVNRPPWHARVYGGKRGS